MERTDAVRQMAEDYLEAVAAAMAMRPEAERREVLAQLSEQLDEAVRNERPLDGESPEEAMGRIIEGMDPPESFVVEDEEDGAGAAAAGGAAAGPADGGGRRRGPGGWWWFALALLFFAVNVWGILRTGGGGGAEEGGAVEEPEAEVEVVRVRQPPPPPMPPERILRLRRVSVMEVSAERRATLLATFSAVPDRLQLTRHFVLSDSDGEKVEYRLEGMMGENTVALSTDPVYTTGLHWAFSAGLESAEQGVRAADLGAEGNLEINRNMGVDGVTAEVEAFEEPAIRFRLTGRPEESVDKLARYVEVKPEAEFKVWTGQDWRGHYLVLRGAFEPDAVYQVTLRAGLPGDVPGQSLARDFTRTLQIPRPRPTVRMEKSGRYLPPGGPLAVPVRTCGMRSVQATASRVYPNNLADAAMSSSLRDWDVISEEWRGKPNTLTNIAVDVDASAVGGGRAAPGNGRALLPLRTLSGEEEPRGAWWIEVSPGADAVPSNGGGDDDDDYYWSYRRRSTGDRQLVVVTDIGLSARMETGHGNSREGAWVWANSLRTAKAAEGVRVEVHSTRHQVLAAGETDADGIAHLEWDDPGDGGRPAVITASKDGDLTYLPLDRPLSEESGGSRAWPRDGMPEAAFAAGRGVYRPGENACIEAYVRGIGLDIPESFPAVAVLRSPDGRRVLEKPVETGPLGTIALEMPIPEDAATGRWSLSLEMPGANGRGGAELGCTSFAVEDFMPPQIRVDAKGPEGRQPASAKTIHFSAKAEYLFGGPAAHLPVDGAITWTEAAFAPDGWKGWTFGDDHRRFGGDDDKLGEYILDDDGRIVYAAQCPSWAKPPAALRAVFCATVRTSGGHTVSAFAGADVDPYPFYIGLRPAWEGTVPVAVTQRVRIAAVAPDGRAPPADRTPALLLSLVKVEWNCALRRNTSGHYEWRSEREEHVIARATKTLSPEGEGDGAMLAADWAFAATSTGDWEIIAEDPESDAATRIAFHVGNGDGWWEDSARINPAELTLSWAGDGAARPGGKAKLLVKSPFPGEALLTVESDRVLLARRFVLAGNTAEVELDVGDDWAPSVHARVSVLRPAAPGDSAWMGYRAHGSAILRVDRPERRLCVEIAAPGVVRPRSPLEVEIAVTGPDGAPAAAGGEVTLFAVDEAICMLTGHESPDPLARFNELRTDVTELYDFYSDIIEPEPDSPDAISAPGGDGAAGLRKRLNPVRANRYVPLAFWRPRIPLDADGRARAVIELPEFSGEVRLMAVACTPDAIGAADSAVKVRRDLVVQPALPRFLAPGDECILSVPLHNLSAAPMDVRVRVACGGPLACAEPDRSVTLDPGADALLSFPLVADAAAGKAVCTIEAEAAGLPAERYAETLELAVRPAGGLSLHTAYGVLKPGESVDLPPPDGFLAESAERTLRVSSMPSLDLCRALQYVQWYPYGCLEQTTSGAYPLLRSEEWAVRLAPGAWAAGDPLSRVESAIARIFSMQTRNGGFALWPWVRDDDVPDSLYAVRFLLDARAAGYAVPDVPLDAALRWIRTAVLESRLPVSADTFTPEWRSAMRLRAEACRVLAAAGRAPTGWIDRLCERTADLDFAARVHLACALRAAGDPRRAADLLSSLPIPAPRARRGGDCHDGDVREAAMLLDAWLDTDPDAPAVYGLAAYLRSRRNPDGHWGCTQDNALALCAFAKLARRLPPTEMPPAFEWSSGGAPAQRHDASADAPDWERRFPGTSPLRLANTGDAPLYYLLQDEGVATEPPALCSEGIAVERAFFNWDGSPADPAELKQGTLLIVRTTIRKLRDGDAANLAAEDLLPAGWEIENMSFRTSAGSYWFQQQTRHDTCWTDARDDRMLIFPRWFDRDDKATVHYAVRAVSPGTYTLPSVTVTGMYDPTLRAVAPAPIPVRVVR